MATDDPRLILDVTRLVARLGRPVLTGIDRVERVWLSAVLARDPAARFVVGTRAGQMLLPAAAGRRILAWLDDPFAAPDPGPLLSALGPARARRAAALAALWPDRLALAPTARAFGRALAAGGGRPGGGPGGWFLSVGHLNPAGLVAARTVPGLCRAVMVHDTIPLDLGQRRAGARLRPILAEAVAADLCLCPTAAVVADLARHAGPPRAPLVVPLGVAPGVADPGLPPALAGLMPDAAPLFLAVGTIEPRKDQAFLLDLWQALAADPPPGPAPWLVLAGRVGAGGSAIAARAAAMAAAGLPLRHLPDLGDGAVAALLGRARALLAPSRAEGFGLVPAEAARRGLPVLARPLPATREVLGDYPVYLPGGATYPWLAAIRGLLAGPPAPRPLRPPLRLAGWDGHLARVFARIDGAAAAGD